ncbi:MAG: exonuclease subunit SbcC [Xenococcaceae cyanobacterium]
MIPLQLTLKNFLSYREASLDFRGLHTACICGANGAGKSSLLEAMIWAIWGQSRTVTEDDVIHAGATNVRVDFDFIYNNQTYRVIRSRPRGRSSSLEFQIQNESGYFRSLTAKGLRATQQQIVSCLKLDYDTFINSAYLRQGRADEFMLRRPNERKQILADLLKLDQYEEMANKAKDLSRQYKAQAEQLEQSLQPYQEQLEQKDNIARERVDLERELMQLHREQACDREKIEQLQAIEHQRQAWEQQLTWEQDRYQNLVQDCDRTEKDLNLLDRQLDRLQKLLDRDPEINAGYEELQRLQRQEESLGAKLAADRDAQQQKQELQQQLVRQINELNLQIRQTQTQFETLQEQEKELQQIVSQTTDVDIALEKLSRHRQHLKELDRLQLEVSPLLQQRQHLQTDIERAEARLSAKLEQLKAQEAEFSQRLAQLPQMRQTAIAVNAEIDELDKKRVYQKRVEEKGLERKSFQTRLQETQRNCEKQLQELRQKLQMLQIPDATCPLCEQELDEHHRDRVITKTQNQHQDLEEQFWVIRDQLSVCERELQVLRGEYKQLDRELSPYTSLQQQLGQLEAQLEVTGEINSNLQQIKGEIEDLERSLVIGNYAEELHSELKVLNLQLQNLNYDERTHALARDQVDNYRWAEIKKAKIEDAKRRQAAIDRQKPELAERVVSLEQEISSLQTTSLLKQKIQHLENYLVELGYDGDYHQNLLASLRQAQSWQIKYRELQQAQQQCPQLQKRHQELEQLWQSKQADLLSTKEKIVQFVDRTAQINDNRAEIQNLEQQIQQKRQKLDEAIASQGRLEQLTKQIETIETQYEQNQKQLKELRRKTIVHQELSQAFGKNGIQALMIENVLPQLEAETNQILARLTENQLHVQFLTQRSSKGSNSHKLIDTLDILIADARGTRPYETYSGGEAFRINFSIRLALARLLAQRAGTSLQMLIVDEGFGTQDAEGCDRLIAAINAIASDFSCILTVTHMPQFKEAFQTRIEVYKTNLGSQLSLST